MLISVIGTGYLGAVHAVCMAELGYKVIGFDTDEHKISTFNKGEAPFFEPQFGSLLGKHLASKTVAFTTDPAQIADADVHFICVGTPQAADGFHANTEYIDAAFENIVKYAKAGSFVVGKSTVPVGTARRLRDALLARRNGEVGLVWNPEFLREGFAVQDTISPDRLVFGINPGTSFNPALNALREVYATALAANTPLVVTDRATAELVKIAANSFLATKISFINAMSEIAEATGANVTELADAIGYDARIGRRFLNAGVGFGGGCLPKDIRAFSARAEELGLGTSVAFLNEVDEINLRQRQRVVDKVIADCGGEIADIKVAVLGLAFKPLSDDVRDSPALDVARRLHHLGARVLAFDPEARGPVSRVAPEIALAENVDQALLDADIAVLVTEWPEFVELDPRNVGDLMKHKRIVDARNVLDPAAWRAAGFHYSSMGRP